MLIHFGHQLRDFRCMELAIASEIISVAVLSARCRAVQWRFFVCGAREGVGRVSQCLDASVCYR